MVYAIICTKCRSTVYVGETERELQERMTEHLRDVRLRKDKPINFHFGEKGHTQHDMAFTVLEKVYAAERIETIKARTLDKEAVHCAARGLQCTRLFHTSSYSVTLWRKKLNSTGTTS